MPREREIEVGAGRHDRGVVPAELEDRPAEAGSHDRGDLAAHRRRPGGRQDRHALVRRERSAHLAATQHHLRDVGGSVGVGGRPLEQGLTGERRERSLVARLPDHRVAAHDRQRRVPRPHRDREVERADDTHWPHRVPRLHQPVTGALGRDGEPVQLPRQTDGEVADVDHLLHLAEALGADLARLDRHQFAELSLVLAEQLAEAAHHVAARRRRRLTPHAERRSGALDGVVDRAGAAGRAERAAGDRRARRLVAVGGGATARREERGSAGVELGGGGQRVHEGSPIGGCRGQLGSGQTAADTAAHASAMIDSAVRACSAFTTSGGARRMPRLPHVSTSRPRSKHACSTASAVS